MSTGYPGSNSVFVPSYEASGKLMVDYSRNVKDFPVNQYTSIIKVERNAGYYLRHTPDEAARALGTSGDEFIWADGSAGRWNTVNKEFEFVPYATRRYAYDFTLGDLTTKQAAWEIVSNYAATSAALAMTQRTRKVLAALTDTGVMPTATATAQGGGKWDVGTTSNPYIKLGLMKTLQAINKATNGVVKTTDLALIINPYVAAKMAASAEISDYLKSSPFSMDVVRNNLSLWGLPDYLYGIKVVIEDCVAVTSKRGLARVDQYALDSTSAIIAARPGALETTQGTFSTCATFMYEEMTVESYRDELNRRTVGRVVEDFSANIVSPISGFYLTAVCAAP